MKIGYARISTSDQNLDLQIDALKNADCGEIFSDVISGSKEQRPGLDKAFGYLREGDTFVVWKLDRLGRSIRHLIDMIKYFEQRKISFICLQENIDTSTSTGKLIFHIFGALAEFERDLIRERTNAGLKVARARGKLGGRSYKLDPKQKERMFELYHAKNMSITEICKVFNISKQSLYNYMKANG